MTVLRVLYDDKDYLTNAWTAGPYLDGTKTLITFKNGNRPDIVFAMHLSYESFCVYCRNDYADLQKYCKGKTLRPKAELSIITYLRLEKESLDAIVEVIGEGVSVANNNAGKSAMRDWFLARLKTLLPEDDRA